MIFALLDKARKEIWGGEIEVNWGVGDFFRGNSFRG